MASDSKTCGDCVADRKTGEGDSGEEEDHLCGPVGGLGIQRLGANVRSFFTVSSISLQYTYLPYLLGVA